LNHYRSASREALRIERLQRDADCNPGAAGIPAVVQVIPVVHIVNVNIIGLIPIGSPVFRIGIHGAHPIAAVLKARKTSYEQEGQIEDVEGMLPAIVCAEVVVRNTISVVAAALLPIAMLGLEAACAMLFPGPMLLAFLRVALFLRALDLPVLLPILCLLLLLSLASVPALTLLSLRMLFLGLLVARMRLLLLLYMLRLLSTLLWLSMLLLRLLWLGVLSLSLLHMLRLRNALWVLLLRGLLVPLLLLSMLLLRLLRVLLLLWPGLLVLLFAMALLFALLLVLRVGRGNSDKHRKNDCTRNFNGFHICYPNTSSCICFV
jgi:hypothetical protein